MSSRSIFELLKDGLELHGQGELEQAGQVYGEILSINPEQSEALHLLGIAAHQMGEHESAARAIARAIALRPGAAHYHANLGAVYRTIGHHHRSAACLHLAKRLRPDGFDEAAEDYDVLIRTDHLPEIPFKPSRGARMIEPALALEHTNMAIDLLARGDLEGAIDQFSRAARLAPGMGEAHSNLGRVLLEGRRVQEALFHCGEAVRLAPDLALAWNNLGNVLRVMGRSTEAKANYIEALRIDPDLAIAHLNLGRVAQDDGWLNDAVTWFRIGLDLDPSSVEIRWSLASALEELGQFAEAAEHCERALEIDPESAEAHVCLGSIRHANGRLDDATGHFLRAIRARPLHVAAHCSLGVVWKQLGDLESAERCFRDVLRLPVDHTRALTELARLLRGKLPSEDLAAIERSISDPGLTDVLRADLHLGVAEVLDIQGDYARAADHVRRGREIKRSQTARSGREYRVEYFDEYVDDMIAACSPEFFERVEGFGLATERPIFIFGLPRSGTTLTEQIVAAHTLVRGAGELKLARAGFESLPNLLGSTSLPEKCIGRLDRETADRLALEHLAGLDKIGGDAPRVVDKMPENFHYLGLLAALFPRARFIHCRRDLRDVAVSCWFTNFREIRWADHPDYIAERFAAYRRLMDHWAATIPVPILEVDYEETVADLEGTARRLVDWCGLDWEPACLDFHKPRNLVKTASATQIRQPIYTRSVGRWKNYEAELGTLFDRLERLMPADSIAPGNLAESI